MVHEFVPFASTLAGSALTYQNWQDAGVRTLALDFKDLLFRPGFRLLNTPDAFRKYYSWPGKIILLADPGRHKEKYQFRSPWDGQIIRHGSGEIAEIIQLLRPDAAVVSLELAEQIHSHKPDFEVFITGAELPWLISDRPAAEGLQGRVYLMEGVIPVTDPGLKQRFEVPDSGCFCPVCRSGFTLSYLQHLYLQTPLLASRYLIQHNAAQIVNRCNSLYDVTLSGQPEWPL